MATLSACRPITPPAPTDTIQGILWQWSSDADRTESTTQAVPNPEVYTLILDANGTLVGQAECNSIAGTYSQENGFSISLGASTMAFCGEASLDQRYLQLLGQVAEGGPDGTGGLALETAGGAERMMFQNGGQAQTP